MAKRIALAGRPLAGKTTLAKVLVRKYGYRHGSMSDLIVYDLVSDLKRKGLSIDVGEVLGHKEVYRGALQSMGDRMGYQDPGRILHLMYRVLVQCEAWSHPDDPVVLESMRGPLQASAARALGFTVVNLRLDPGDQRERAGSEEAYRRVRESMRARPDLESGVETAEIQVSASLPFDQIAQLIVDLPEGGLSHGPISQPFSPGSLADWGRSR